MVIVDVGAFFLVLPGLALFVYLSLAGPVVELEKRGVRDGLLRSFRLVRGHFWIVAAIVFPTFSNVLTAPFFAVAVVLLTLELIHQLDGTGPALKRRPAPIPATAVLGET